MGRPRKNGVESPQITEGDKLPTNDKNAQNSTSIACQTQRERIMLPISVEQWAEQSIIGSDVSSLLIMAPVDIEVKKGRMYIDTGINIINGYYGLIFPTPLNAAYGIETSVGYRMMRSDIIPMKVQNKVKLVLNIEDETSVRVCTASSTRFRNLIIPKGVPLAELVLFKK